MLPIIPVIDLRGGKAVHARGGERAHYAPVRSILHEGADPLELAAAYRDKLGLDAVYLADLDAIAGDAPARKLYDSIGELPLTLWVDAGVVSGAIFDDLDAILVAGLETLQGPQILRMLIERRGADRVAFSLDLRDGKPLVATQKTWGTDDPRELVEMARDASVNRLIVLDLARVGSNSGVGTLPLIRAIRRDHAALEIVAGGGIAGPGDLGRLEDAGASAALVGSALHDGRIGADHIRQNRR